MRSTPQDDAASTHVLEAVVVATIMVSAVAFVATFEVPPSSTTPTRDNVRQRAQDALDGLYDIPVENNPKGDNLLSVLLAECMQDRCGNLTDRMDRLLPKGSSYSIYMSNGYATFPIYEPRDPSGEAITVSHLLEPKWSSSFVTTGTTNVNPALDTLVTYSLPIFNSNTLSQGGSPLRVIVHGVRTSDGANYTVTGFFSTQSVAPEDKDLYPAISTYFLQYGKPVATIDVTHETIGSTTGQPTKKEVEFTLRLNESAGVAVPAGTELTLSLPRGWTASANQTVNAANWTILANATDMNASYASSEILARMTTDLTGTTRDFVFKAVFHGDILEYYPFQARLSKGALSESNLLVRASKGVAAPSGYVDAGPYAKKGVSPGAAYSVPQVGMSVPRPMGSAAKTTWTLNVDVPDRADESISVSPGSAAQIQSSPVTKGGYSVQDARPSITIHSIEIIEQDGAPIFSDIQPLSGTGTWTSKGDRLVWEGTHINTRPLALTFNVVGSGVAGAGTAKNPFVPPVEFPNPYKSRMLNQVAPGFYRGVFLPSSIDAPDEVTVPPTIEGKAPQTYPGYPVAGYDTNPPDSKIGVQYDFASNAVYKSSLLPGTSNYTLNPITSFQDSIHGSYVNVERRSVPIGGTVSLTADVQSLLFALSQAGISAGVNLHFYPPWSGDERDPIWSQDNLDSGILGSDVTTMMLLEMNDDGYPDIIVGTSNGRVLALHGLTGARLQGGVFTAPLQAGAKDGTVTSITHLLPLTLDGKDHIVVGTDKEGRGVYVLDKTLTARWSHDKSGHEAVSMDAGVDIDGDKRADVLLGLENGGVYVLRALEGRTTLLPHQGPASDRPVETDLPDAFYTSLGEPSTIVGLDRIGPNTTRAGLAVTFQSTPGVGTTVVDTKDPTMSEVGFVTSLPRSGFQGVDSTGAATWTFFGSPVTVARTTDHDNDKVTDVVAGGSAGYVFMMNGTTATQPLFSQLHYSAKTVLDAEGFDPFHAMFLTADGQVRMTTDGWTTVTCAYCSPVIEVPTLTFPEARSIAVNGSHSFWLAGPANLLLRSVPGSEAEVEAEKPAVTIDPMEPSTPETPETPEAKETEAPHYPHIVFAPPVGSKEGVPGDYFKAYTHNFNDITFRAYPHNDLGWVVAGPCVDGVSEIDTGECQESLVMRTTDGGVGWTILGNGMKDGLTGTPALVSYQEDGEAGVVTAELTRINFTTDKIGWIVGYSGTILRTLDGGATWHGIAPPTFETEIVDVSCAQDTPDFCIAITPKGAYVTDHAVTGGRHVAWKPLDLKLTTGAPGEVPYSRSLKSVGVVDPEVAYIGAENMVLKTNNGGANWTALPMNYVESDGNRTLVFPDGRGYIFGGNVSTARIFFLHDYALRSSAQTTKIDIPKDTVVKKVSLRAEYSEYEGTFAVMEVSTNGGHNWQGLDLDKAGIEGQVREEGSIKSYAETQLFTKDLDPENYGSDLRLRINLQTKGDTSLLSVQLRNPVLYLELGQAADPYNTSIVLDPIPIDLTKTDLMDEKNTTATWDTRLAVIHQPLVTEYWTRNVSGEVNDIRTGYDVAGDWRSEVWVATGGVLASNSPEHAVYAGTDLNKFVRNDNRIYLLDGEKGIILANTTSFAGEVVHLALGDGNRDGYPEYLYATTWDASRSNGTVMALNATTLQIEWSNWLDIFQPSALVANNVEGLRSAPIVGTRAHETGQNAIPGKVYSFKDDTGEPNWASIPDQLGRYVVTKKIPTNWLFGPYVVEVEVQWTNDVNDWVDGVSVTRQVLQTARFYDYFLVTPPDALSPPSPVYQVHLVTWLNDWG